MGRSVNLYQPNRIYTSPMVVKMSIVGFDYVLQCSALCNIANGVGFYTHPFVGMLLGDFSKVLIRKHGSSRTGSLIAQSGPELQSLSKRGYVDLLVPSVL